MAPQPDLSGLGKLLESIASQNTNMFPQLSSLPVGLTGSNIKNAFSPEVLLSSGMLGGQSFQPMIDSVYNDLLASYNQQVQKLTALPYEATFQSLSFNRDPLYAQGTEIGELMRDTIDAISAGGLTADQAIASISEGISSGVVPQEVTQYLPKIGDDLANFADKELPAYQKAVDKHKYDSAQALANAGITEPTIQDARLKFFKDMGMPEMALLPDPAEKYNVDPEQFMDPKVLAKVKSQQTEAARQIASEESRLYGELKKEGGWAARTKRLGGVLAGAKEARTGAEQEYLRKNMPKDQRDFISKGMDFLGRDKIFGGLFGGDRRGKEVAPIKAEAKARGQQALEDYVISNASKIGQGRNVYDLSPRAREARNKQLVAEAAMRGLMKGAAPKVAQTEQMLSNLGLTPYQQAMNQILANAVSMQTKVR